MGKEKIIRLLTVLLQYVSFSSASTTNTISSTALLHIGSQQTLRDLYSNARSTGSKPRKMFVERVREENQFFFLN